MQHLVLYSEWLLLHGHLMETMGQGMLLLLQHTIRHVRIHSTHMTRKSNYTGYPSLFSLIENQCWLLVFTIV